MTADTPIEQRRKIRVAFAAHRAYATLAIVEADIGGEEALRAAQARLREYLSWRPGYVVDEARRYFGSEAVAAWGVDALQGRADALHAADRAEDVNGPNVTRLAVRDALRAAQLAHPRDLAARLAWMRERADETQDRTGAVWDEAIRQTRNGIESRR